VLFNSYTFIFLFLPLAVAGYFIAARLSGRTAAMLWLIAASLFFYGWWNPSYLWLLGAVMVFTYLAGRALSARPDKRLLAFAIAVDLGVLVYYKYANFLVDNAAAVTGQDWSLGRIVLPLAISFFTFQKIAYLVDSYRGLTKGYNFIEYTLFVAFFPQLIAGPIVHYKEVLPQFRLPETFRPHAENFAVGLTIFAMGLFKKAVLADGIAVYATPVFTAVQGGTHPDLLTAWAGALAYTFQLYFDFSGYSDMAIGGARLFGIKLPQNFNSPYKAANIIDFWRRWHMTLSRFLRDYLYISLGGNRKGEARRYLNLFITMLLGGIWHGAGWNFVIWGALHGFYLTANHGWRRIAPARLETAAAYRLTAWTLTMLAVVVGWVFFRAPTLEVAMRMIAGMAGLNGVALPQALEMRLGGLATSLESLGVTFSMGGGATFISSWIWIVALFGVACFLPNSQEIMGRFKPVIDATPDQLARRLLWKPNAGWAFGAAIVAVGGVLALTRVSEFLYFQF
jgi:alginate O-acetyltransferase complex protein AlgI